MRGYLGGWRRYAWPALDGGDGLCHLVMQVGVPRGRHADGLGEDRRLAVARHAVQGFVPPVIAGDTQTFDGRSVHLKLGDFFVRGEPADQVIQAFIQ